MKNKYLIIAIIGLIVWFAETAYFGFNKNAQSGVEATFDMLAIILMGYGFIGDLLTNLQIHKHFDNSVKYYYTNTDKPKK